MAIQKYSISLFFLSSFLSFFLPVLTSCCVSSQLLIDVCPILYPFQWISSFKFKFQVSSGCIYSYDIDWHSSSGLLLQQSMRRLAQNREAARKSRLRKKVGSTLSSHFDNCSHWNRRHRECEEAAATPIFDQSILRPIIMGSYGIYGDIYLISLCKRPCLYM